MKKDITILFCFVDDFSQAVDKAMEQRLLEQNIRKPTRTCSMSMSEILTITLLYYQSPCKNFEYFYKSYLQLYKKDFPNLLSYNRFIEVKSRSLTYLTLLLNFLCSLSSKTGIAYIDATALAVCGNKRIKAHKLFKEIAQRSKTTKGWFFGLKLHLLINEKSEIIGFEFTQGNVDDRVPVPHLTKHLIGLLFGDKGYVSQPLFNSLMHRGLKLVTGIKKKMKNKLMILKEKILLKKRSVIESVFDILKNHFELEHTRHRSIPNACVHLLATLVAYCLRKKKPSIKFNFVLGC